MIVSVRHIDKSDEKTHLVSIGPGPGGSFLDW